MIRRRVIPTIALSGAAWFCAATYAESDAPTGHVHLDETVISGNQELPKVLYIVPWQDPTGMPKIEIDPNFTEHELFRHVYPATYRREIEYYDALKAAGSKQ